MPDAQPKIHAREGNRQDLGLQTRQLIDRTRPDVSAGTRDHARAHHLGAKRSNRHQAVHPVRRTGWRRVAAARRSLDGFRERFYLGNGDLLFLERGDLRDAALACAPFLCLADD